MNEKPSKNEYKISRREFIINTVLAGAITASAISAIDYFTQNILAVGLRHLINGWKSYSGITMKQTRSLLEEDILGRSLSAFSIDVGNRHPLYENKLHPDNLKLAKSFYQLLVGKDELMPVDDGRCLYVDYEKSVWAIGGAMSTWTSYRAENYQGAKYNLKWTGKSKLPWRMVYSEKELEEFGVLSYSTRYVEVDGVLRPWSVPNWVAIENETGEFLSAPTSGEIIQQPLLISKLPNTIGRTPESKHEVVLITEAPHGDGTRGFELLLKDIEKLEEWHKEIGNYDYFQSRFKVTLLCKGGIPQPSKIEHIETRQLTKKNIK